MGAGVSWSSCDVTRPISKEVQTESGVVVYEGTFKDDKKHGAFRVKEGDGTIVETHYDNDKLHGPARIIFQDQEIWSTTFRHGTGVMAAYQSGQKMSETPYRDGKLHGLARSWFRQSPLECEYVEGQKHGQCQEASERRSFLSPKPYEAFAPFSDELRWFRESQLIESGRYENGARAGVWKLTRDGRKVAEGSYEKVGRNGEWSFWDEGILVANGKYVADKPEGEWTFWRDAVNQTTGDDDRAQQPPCL